MDKADVKDSTVAVEVRTSARLHLGFLDLNGGLGRRFGSIGLALEAPGMAVGVRAAARRCVAGREAERAGRYLAALERALALPGAHALTVGESFPAHAGLGSGTQLALAIGAALRRLHGRPADTVADAVLLGRGGRSGIGIALFDRGGLVVDGGHRGAGGVPPLLAHLPVPPEWRVVLVLDPGHEGLSGQAERVAFAALPPMPAARAGAICRAVLMQALPALAEADLGAFGAAVATIQEVMGDHFAPAQGDRFTSPRVAAALGRLAAAGAVGTGQSSWGPTGFAFLPDEASAGRCLAAVGATEGLEFLICRAANHGARVSMFPA